MTAAFRWAAVALLVALATAFQGLEEDECANHDLSCDECIQWSGQKMDEWGCGWCADPDLDESVSRCMNGTYLGPNNDRSNCRVWEWHDNAFYGSTCCSTMDNCSSCVDISWCTWCVDGYATEEPPEDDAELGLCFFEAYSGEVEDTAYSYNCTGHRDSNFCCEESADKCENCKEYASCLWCATEHLCIDSLNAVCEAIVDDCCKDTLTCSKCQSQDSGITPSCFWCRTQEQCLSNEQLALCDQPLLLGADYCGGCYTAIDRSACVADEGCVWLEAPAFTSDSHPAVTSFCAEGGLFGPLENDVTYGSTRYNFKTTDYYWGFENVRGATLTNLIICASVGAFVALIVLLCALSCVRKAKLRKIALISTDGEEFDIPDGENLDVNNLMQFNQVPWEDSD